MSAEAIDAAAPKRRRGMLGFYVAGFLLLALALFGAWFWNAWTNWQFDAGEARRRQQAAADRLGVPVEKTVDLGNGVKLELILIPPGMFDMGAPYMEHIDGPVHRVRISRPFYMGKCEVTREQWGTVMATAPGFFEYNPKDPTDRVSWESCQEFLRKLNALVERHGPFRLPTEAEWEWACRAGTRTDFCFGDDTARLGEYAWFFENSGDCANPVGEKRPNAWGLYDCHGNAWEWCSDWHDRYSANPWLGMFRWVTDPQGPASGRVHVLRGGGWNHDPMYCSSACRGDFDPTGSLTCPGIRVALTLTGR